MKPDILIENLISARCSFYGVGFRYSVQMNHSHDHRHIKTKGRFHKDTNNTFFLIKHQRYT